MDKKEIYEHLAKIYLDASSKSSHKKHKSTRFFSRFLDKPYFLSASLGIAFVLFLFLVFKGLNPRHSETELFLQTDTVKINFNFDPAKKEVYTLTLNKLNLKRFKYLAFSVKKTNPLDKISLRSEFTNSFREKSEVYIRDIPSRWKEYKIPLVDFKKINDWSEISLFSFAVEEWNAKEKRGIVYIDNVRLLN